MAERLELVEVTKIFPNGAVALESVSLEVDRRKLVVLLGPFGLGQDDAVTSSRWHREDH